MVRNGRRLFWGVFALVIIAISAIGGVGYSFWRQVEDQGGLTSFVQDTLNERTRGVVSTIEYARLEFSFSAIPVRLVARNIRLNAADTVLVLPQSEFGFSLSDLMLGQIVPSEMEISGLEIDIEHGGEEWQAGPSVALVTSLLQESQSAPDGADALAAIRKISIDNARLRVSHPARDAENADQEKWLVVEPIAITIQRRNQQLEGNINATSPAGGTVSVDFSTNEAATDAVLTATINGVRLDTIYPYMGVDVPEISQVGEVGGRLAMAIRDRRVESISGDITTMQGRVDLPGYGAMDYDQVDLIFAHDAEKDLLTISNIDVTAPMGNDTVSSRLLISGQVKNVSGDKPVIFTKMKGSNLPVDRVMQAWPDDAEPGLREMIVDSIEGGIVASLGLETVGVIDRQARSFQVTTIDLVSDMRAMRLETSFASVERLVGTLSSRVELAIGNKGSIKHASADFLLLDAQLLPQNASRLIDLEGIEIRTRLEGNALQVTRAAIDAKELGQMAMVATLDLEHDWHAHRLDIKVKAEQIDKTLLTELWPRTLRPRTRDWMKNNISGGVINGLNIEAGFDLPRGEKPETLYLKGNADVVDTSLTYLRTMPPVQSLTASIGFEGRTLRADIFSGMVEGLNIGGSRFIIRQSEAGPEADLALLARGSFGGAVRLLDHERLNLLKPAGLDISEAKGTIDATMGMKWIIPDSGTIKENGGIEVNVSASVEDAELDGLPYGLPYDDGTMDIIYSNRNLIVSGHGILAGAPTVLNLKRQADGKVELDLALAKSDAFTGWIAGRVPLDLGGATGGIISLKGESGMDRMVLDARLDLDSTSINFPRLGLVKLQGEAADMIARFQIDDGKIVGISDVTLDSDVLNIDGNISFDESGRFLGAFLNHAQWPGNDLTNITVERNAEDILRLTASAGLIDLTPLRREDSPGKGISLEIELTADRIILDQSVSLSGNVKLKTDEDGVGEADFLGGLFLGDKPFMTEASLKAFFGNGQDLMDGRGLIGGSEASISLSPSESGGNLLVLRSNNAGQVLKTLNITDAIRSGKLYLVAAFEQDDPKHYNVNFELEDFNVIEAPKAIRVMSVLSLAGLYSLVEGDGTNFSLGHAHLEIFPDRQIIHQARATGTALAVDLVGVIDPVERDMEVSGTMLPLYGLNKLVGGVPIIGEILTGIDHSGLFSTQFSITGDIDDPKSSVNLSSIAPGLLRDIFSPDWVKRERERLIPEGTAQDASDSSPEELGEEIGEEIGEKGIATGNTGG